MTANDVQRQLQKLSNKEKAQVLQRFFKTGPGDYGEGDVFWGIRVPQLRKLATEYRDLGITEVRKSLRSPIHEERLLGLLILVRQYSTGNAATKKRIYELYLQHTRFINNWDLVDATAEHIVGEYLRERSRRPLYSLAKSPTLWERRIAIIATFHYIKHHEFDDTLKIAAILRHDEEDLIHKAVGWMLREVGKRDMEVEEVFLKRYYLGMPRTMLRYAIERFPERKRQRYLKGKV
jgi:3-methyladenine DNA glycosylase AlkD